MPQPAPVLTVLLPTYQEEGNVGRLIRELDHELRDVPHEILVVDDASPDGTVEEALAASPRVRVIRRVGERGLGTAVARGLREALGEHVVVMDADGQHPASAPRRLLETARLGFDLVVGTRHADGGVQRGLGRRRALISKLAAGAARFALPEVRRLRLTDPMSGLFLVRREKVCADAIRPRGYKVLLELVARCRFGRAAEVGYTFEPRRAGASKLNGRVVWEYLTHLASLAARSPSNRRAATFVGIGATGIVVNLAALQALVALGSLPLLAAVLATETAILWNFAWHDAVTFRARRRLPVGSRLARYHLGALVGLLVHAGVFALAHIGLSVALVPASLAAIVVATSANYAAQTRWAYRSVRPVAVAAELMLVQPEGD